MLNNPETITLSLFSKPQPVPSKVSKTFLKQTEGLNFNKSELTHIQKDLDKVEVENAKMTKPKARVKKDDKKPAAKKKQEPVKEEKPPAPKILGPLTDLRKSLGAQSAELQMLAMEEAREIKNYLARECRVKEYGENTNGEKEKETVVDVPLDTLCKAILLAPDIPVHKFYGGEEGKTYPKPSVHLMGNPFPPKKKKGKKKKKK